MYFAKIFEFEGEMKILLDSILYNLYEIVYTYKLYHIIYMI